jgi:hypothetical protein
MIIPKGTTQPGTQPNRRQTEKEPPQQHNARYEQATLLDLARPPAESHTPTFSTHTLRLGSSSLSMPACNPYYKHFGER